jgi:hypothetical protein
MHADSRGTKTEGERGIMGCQRIQHSAKTRRGLKGCPGLLKRGTEVFLGNLSILVLSRPSHDRLRVGVEWRLQLL